MASKCGFHSWDFSPCKFSSTSWYPDCMWPNKRSQSMFASRTDRPHHIIVIFYIMLLIAKTISPISLPPSFSQCHSTLCLVSPFALMLQHKGPNCSLLKWSSSFFVSAQSFCWIVDKYFEKLQATMRFHINFCSLNADGDCIDFLLQFNLKKYMMMNF